MGFERTMDDGEILRRLAGYAKPYWAKFVLVVLSDALLHRLRHHLAPYRRRASKSWSSASLS